MQDRKIEIAEKVCKMFREFGIKSVTMDDIARHLSISKKTLYEYFTDKKDLVKGNSQAIQLDMCNTISKRESQLRRIRQGSF